MRQHPVTAEGIAATAGTAVINLEFQTRARIARIGHSVGCGRPGVAIGSEFVDMPTHDAQRNLREELRTLARRARERRRAAGKADSHRAAVTIANRDYHGGDIQAQRVSEWLSDDDDRFRVPRDSDKVWALVQVWGAWAGERQDRIRWNNLVEAAQPRPSRPPAASRMSAADAGRPVAPTAGAGVGPTTQIAEEFAALAQFELSQELDRLQVDRPYPLPVRWQPGPDDDILATYRDAPSGRLVILGDPGGGKTVLALRLAHALLNERHPDEPVPVMFDLRTWNLKTKCHEWMADTLAERYEALRTKTRWSTLAGELVIQGRILPILDGLDEMSPTLRAAAIKGLPTSPMIMTSTAGAYRAALARTGPIPNVAEITVTGVADDELGPYLRRASTSDWTAVIDELANSKPAATAVREALRTPFAIALARDVYRTGDPTRLLDTAAAGGSVAVERHLVDAFIPTVYSEPLCGSQLEFRRTSRPWHVEDNEEFAVVRRYARTLARLADHDVSRGAIAWWRLYATVPRSFRILFNGVVCLVAALAGVLLAQGVHHWSGGSSTTILSAGFPIAAAAATIGAFLAARDKTMPTPMRTRLRFRGRMLRVLGTFVLVFFLTKALLLPVKAAAWVAGQMDLLALAVVLSWGIGLAAAGTYALRQFVEVPLDLRTVPSTPESYTASRLSLLLTSAIVLASTAIGLIGVFAVALNYATLGLMFAAFAAPMRLAIAILSTAYGRFCFVTRPYFALTGHLPWRMLDFLDDALCRGVLRQVGPLYLFRHERLRRALLADPQMPKQHEPADDHRGSHPPFTPVEPSDRHEER